MGKHTQKQRTKLGDWWGAREGRAGRTNLGPDFPSLWARRFQAQEVWMVWALLGPIGLMDITNLL